MKAFHSVGEICGLKRRGLASVLGLEDSSSYATKFWYEIQRVQDL